MTATASSGRHSSSQASLNVPVRAAGVGLGAPVDAEQPEPVQQHGPGELARAAQVEHDGLRLRGGLEPHRPLLAGQVGGQRHHRRPLGDGAQLAADDQRVVDQRQRHARALAEHRLGRVVELGQPDRRAAAHRGQRGGQPGRLDDRGGRGVELLVAQLARHADQPARGERVVGSARGVQWSKRCWYQPGDVTPAPYPLASASRPDDHGAQVAATFVLGSPLSRSLSRACGG